MGRRKTSSCNERRSCVPTLAHFNSGTPYAQPLVRPTLVMKRDRESDDGEDAFGPVPEPADDERAAPAKKKARAWDARAVAALPCASLYERSYMHRDTVTHVAVAAQSNFILSASADGHVKFWKKQPEGVEFAKHFVAHTQPLCALTVSPDARHAASLSADGTAKIYDVLAFDMMAILELGYTPTTVCWAHREGRPVLAVAAKEPPHIFLYDALSPSVDADGHARPVSRITRRSGAVPIEHLVYSVSEDFLIGVGGAHVDYWDAHVPGEAFVALREGRTCDPTPETHAFPSARVSFSFKGDTDLFVLAKAQTTAHAVALSPDGRLLAIHGADRIVRVLRVYTGRLYRVYDESLAQYAQLQKAEPRPTLALDPIDYGRRSAVERQLETAWAARDSRVPTPSVCFDATSQVLVYATLVGVKLVALAPNRLVGLLGRHETNERFLTLALYQGVSLGSAAEGTRVSTPSPDPTLVCAAFNRHRIYLFSRREPSESDLDSLGRDVFNERPQANREAAPARAAPKEATCAMLHTTLGDIKVRLFVKETPRTVENFTGLARKGYYDSVIFHRVIRGFMVQTGDPKGNGTGGESLWGGTFADEIVPGLKHTAYALAMANAGPNTNGSQFYITTAPAPHLDGKHTVFGRVEGGTDVVGAIERVPVNKRNDKPWDDVRIVSIDLLYD